MRGVDEEHGLVYFIANAESPLERHLYSVSFTSIRPDAENHDRFGLHAVTMSNDTHFSWTLLTQTAHR